MSSVLLRRAKFAVVAVIAVASCLAAPIARADYHSSAAWFQAKPLKDRVLLQLSLILLGDYNALADGIFGRYTYQAIVSYERSQGLDGDGVLSPDEENALTLSASIRYRLWGVSFETDKRTGMKIPIPSRLFISKQKSNWGTHWSSADGSLELETLTIPQTPCLFRIENTPAGVKIGHERTLETLPKGLFMSSRPT